MPTKCFLLEPTDRVRQSLRRYHSSAAPGEACPAQKDGYSYHNAEVQVEDAPAIYRPETPGVVFNSVDEVSRARYENDPRWPTHCACGYAFTEEDPRQLFINVIYRRADTGEEVALRDAPAGAMWWADWMGQFCHPQLGRCIAVRLPDGTDWMPDSQANNCTMPDDTGQERHHCWIIEGTPPNLTVSKNGPTCQAGAGSIATARYHGFLRNGWLTD